MQLPDAIFTQRLVNQSSLEGTGVAPACDENGKRFFLCKLPLINKNEEFADFGINFVLMRRQGWRVHHVV